MKSPLTVISLLSAFAFSAQADISIYAEYRLGEDGVRERPRDNSGNGRHFVSGAEAGTDATTDLSPATVTTAVLRTNEELFTAFRADMSALPDDNFAVGIYARIPADNAATLGHVFSLGPRDPSVLRVALEADGWVANYRTADGSEPGIPIGDPVALVTDTWVHLAVIRKSGAATFYVDGVAQGLPEALTTPVHGTNGHFGIDSGGARRIQGHFDDLRMLSFTVDELEPDILAALQGIDSDPGGSDGLLDTFEQRIIDADAGDLITGLDDVLPGDDFDGDGATNLQEMDAATDPTDAIDVPFDRDRDGMEDAWEQQIIDANAGDLITTVEEVLPEDDYDGDTFSNLDEFTALPTQSDPTLVGDIPLDSDRDLMLDTFEQDIIDFAVGDGVETLAEVLPDDNFDNDSLTNLQEFNSGTDPTDPGDPAIADLSLIGYWDFNDNFNPLLAEDLVDDMPGIVVSPAVYTADAEGKSGTAGDLAIDLGGQNNGAYVLVEDASFLNVIALNQKMSFSMWAKAAWTDAAGDPQTGQIEAATGLPNSPQTIGFRAAYASDAGSRVFQSHMPWSNNDIFWDQPGNRPSPSVNGLSGTSAEDRKAFWEQWHHFVLLRNGTNSQVWVDGELLGESNGSNTDWIADFATLGIGASQTGATSMTGLIDDVAIYHGALSESQIKLLAAGASPFAAVEEPFKITDYTRVGDLITLTWESVEGATETFTVRYSFDLDDWSGDLDDGIPSDAGDSTTRSFDLTVPGIQNEGRVYFRVERN